MKCIYIINITLYISFWDVVLFCIEVIYLLWITCDDIKIVIIFQSQILYYIIPSFLFFAYLPLLPNTISLYQVFSRYIIIYKPFGWEDKLRWRNCTGPSCGVRDPFPVPSPSLAAFIPLLLCFSCLLIPFIIKN